MSAPVFKIEVWEPGGGSPLYTITKDAPSINIKPTVTENIGTFNFSLVEKKDDYVYNDIEVFDKVKIWLGYESVSGDPLFIGKIYQITGLLNEIDGFMRLFVGRDLGEVLRRRIKAPKIWDAVEASTVVTELANDLSLGTSQIEATSGKPVSLIVDEEQYFDVLRKISDYWINADTQIKKDFYVDINNNLVWKSRPHRQTGVETLTVGKNIGTYCVYRDSTEIKNKIKAYGAETKRLPATPDGWTDSLTGWGVSVGELSLNSDRKLGSYSIQCIATGTQTAVDFYYVISPHIKGGLGKDKYKRVNFWYKFNSAGSTWVALLCPDHSNYLMHTLGSINTNEWSQVSFDFLSNADFTEYGSPNLDDWGGIRFYHNNADLNGWMRVDDLYLNKTRFSGLAEDSASQTNYQIRELVHIDDMLKTDADCTKRAGALLYEKKNPLTRLNLTIDGNSNVKIGDKLTITIPAENIVTQDFYVVSVEHNLAINKWMTQVSMINTLATRIIPPATMNEVLLRKFEVQNEVARGIQIVK